MAEAALAPTGRWELEIVHRCDRHRFVVLPKRWIIERTLAWISRNRRRARDYEQHARKAVAFVRLSMIRPMLHRLAAKP
jgi:transposase